jgi:hypothetical protein
MTAQWPDSCTFDGRKWVVEHWEGSQHCVPTNEQLGFNTVSPSTANWTGRIDHFLVHRGRLYLFKIEVTLPPENESIRPLGARRETLIHYEQWTVCDGQGERQEERQKRYEYFVYDDLLIPFTGRIHLTFPFFDYWEVPWPLQDEDEETLDETVLEFSEGVLL